MNTKFNYLAEWPAEEDASILLTIDLHESFSFRHYASFRNPKPEMKADQSSGAAEDRPVNPPDPFFLKPESAVQQIKDFLRQEYGGSLLVSGYRGTGKSSIVHCALNAQFPSSDPRLLKIELNLSTIDHTLDVLLLLLSQLETELEDWLTKREENLSKSALEKDVREKHIARAKAGFKRRLKEIRDKFAVSSTVKQSDGPGVNLQNPSLDSSSQDVQHSFERSVTLGQQVLERFLRSLTNELPELAKNVGQTSNGFKIVIIYDELDKLIPAGSLLEAADSTASTAKAGDKASFSLRQKAQRMAQMQKIVADLKFLFTESRCHHIFIAGKDADESWQEDQHKGEGIFESVFAYNVYVRSLFSAEFQTESEKGNKTDQDVGHLAVIGISPHSMSANTGRLVLRMLHESVREQLKKQGGQKQNQEPLTEVQTRALRIFIHFLTYKGRGIPRKVLREFYSYVRSGPAQTAANSAPPNGKSASAKYHLEIRLYEMQRMTFYAELVEQFDEHFGEFQRLDDKGRVSLFHIVDYILKFYETGFSKQSIESANFMTSREELFPGQRLVSDVIDFLDGRLFVRKDRRSPEYRLLPGVVHDLTKLFLRHGPEQMELRHTAGEFDLELRKLGEQSPDVHEGKDNRRRNSIVSLIRLGRVYEHLGQYLDARITYGTAMRSLRQDIESYSRNSKRYADANATEQRDFSDSFLATYVGYAVKVLQRIGHLHDMVNEHRAALQFYAEAIDMHRRLSNLDSCKAGNFPYELFSNTEMSLERTLGTESAVRQHLYYTDETPALKDGLGRLHIEGEPEGVIHSYNHAAVSAEKTWARQAANGYLLSALNYQHAVNDEYGMIDQFAFIAEVMIRRREMRPAALWLLMAIKQCADLFTAAHPKLEEGTPYAAWRWSTPSAQTQTIAQLLTCLGDIYFATNGLAFVPKRDEETRDTRHQAFWNTVGKAIPRLITETRPFVYFYEHARLLFESCGESRGIIDVRMRQLEMYVEVLDVRMRAGDKGLSLKLDGTDDALKLLLNKPITDAVNADVEINKEIKEQAYEMLRTWVSFWADAKACLFELLSTKPALMRENTRTWGNVKDRRQMGNLMRLVGEVLSNMALTGHLRNTDASAGDRIMANEAAANFPDQTQQRLVTLLVERVEFLRNRLAPSMRGLMASFAKSMLSDHSTMAPEFSLYEKLIAAGRSLDEKQTPPKLHTLLMKDFQAIEFGRLKQKDKMGTPPNDEELKALNDRLADWTNPLVAADHLGDIFAYISDEAVGITGRAGKPMSNITEKVGKQSLLWKAVDRKPPSEGGDHLLIGQQLIKCLRTHGKDERSALETDLTLLALAEKALLTGHMNYRECLPSSGHAQLCLALGKCYSRMIYLSINDEKRGEFDMQKLQDAYRLLHLHAKRFLTLCVSMVEQEPEQRPFARQVGSEALFILGDLMFEWWCSCHWDAKHPNSGDNAKVLKELSDARLRLDPKIAHPASFPDTDQTDIKRQVMTYYQTGLRYVMQELNEHQSRYPLPQSVQYAHRNLLDTDTQFDIARAVHKRHALPTNQVVGSGDESAESRKLDARKREKLLKVFDDIGLATKQANNPFVDPVAWVDALLPILERVNEVRTDRGPLQPDKVRKKITWTPLSGLSEEHTIILFPNRGAADPQTTAPPR